MFIVQHAHISTFEKEAIIHHEGNRRKAINNHETEGMDNEKIEKRLKSMLTSLEWISYMSNNCKVNNQNTTKVFGKLEPQSREKVLEDSAILFYTLVQTLKRP